MNTLFYNKKECCGCTACGNICQKQAISMKPDEDGFLYPVINQELCVECGLCKKICPINNLPVTTDKPLATYAAINKNQSILSTSASGGVFPALASLVLERNGVVFGCAYENDMDPVHICIDNPAGMMKLQGSKYVQSSINTSYAKAKVFLLEGRWVLFTGTPCQIAGLKSYLGKDYNNLITVDLICHGVPSAAFFKGYIKHLEGKLKGKIKDFKFRDKSKGWGKTGKVFYEKKGIIREDFIPPITSYYYNYFLKGDIYRENCYECRYAGGKRQGDFTIGDYWGIEKVHPKIDTKKGVSVLLVNSKKGIHLINELENYLILVPSTFEQAKEKNSQLRKPTSKSKLRDLIFKTWREGGSQAVAKMYNKMNRKQIVMWKLKSLMPLPVKQVIKTIIRRKREIFP